MQQLQTVFRCPACADPLTAGDGPDEISCSRCASRIPVVEGVPVLVKDLASIESAIAEARESARAPWYDEPHGNQWVGPYRHHLQKRRRYVEGLLAAQPSVRDRRAVGLDLGCGDGVNMVWLQPYFKALFGSDYNLLRLLRATKLVGPEQVVMADITDYPAVDNAFDVVFLNHVLEHVAADDRALAEVRRIVKPGGVAIVGVPNEGAWFWQLAYRLQPKTRATTDHVHFYTAETLVQKCKAAGFAVVEVHPMGWGIPHWSLDALVRRFAWIDDLFDRLGRALLPSQATSLYIVVRK